jgi:hypothetical protein
MGLEFLMGGMALIFTACFVLTSPKKEIQDTNPKDSRAA